MALEFSAYTIELISLGIFAFTLAIIFGTRYHLAKQSQLNLTEKYKDHEWSNPLEARTKYPELDAFQFRSSFLAYGLVLALCFVIMALSWSVKDERADIGFLLGDIAEDIEIETPRTMEPPPPPPPPPAPQALALVANDMPELETVIFEDQSITEDSYVDAPKAEVKKEAAPPPPPPPPPPMEEEKEIFRIVEEMPTFPGCESVTDKAERKTCAEQKLLSYLSENIKYPTIARENRVQGMVVLQFVVETDGSITDVKVVRDIGAKCGEEAIRVVKEMPTWNPGKQRGRAVRVQFTLPVRFILA